MKNKQENYNFYSTKMAKKKVDFDFKCLKFHLKFIRKTTTNGSVLQASPQVNESVTESGESPTCCVYFYVKSPVVVLIFFKIFFFLLHQFVLIRSFQNLRQCRF